MQLPSVAELCQFHQCLSTSHSTEHDTLNKNLATATPRQGYGAMIPHQGRGEGPDESASNTGDQAHRGEKNGKKERKEIRGTPSIRGSVGELFCKPCRWACARAQVQVNHLVWRPIRRPIRPRRGVEHPPVEAKCCTECRPQSGRRVVGRARVWGDRDAP